MPSRVHDPGVIHWSRLICAKAYLIRNTRLPFSELDPVSRAMSGVILKATRRDSVPLKFR